MPVQKIRGNFLWIIDIALTKAEELFKRGKYKESLDLSTKSISFIDKNIIDSD